MQYYSPLRYPGGKGKLSFYIKNLIEQNGLSDSSYVEPYTGGGAVAFDLLINEYVRRIYINDVDPAIYSFWFSVLNHTDELCRMIKDVDVDLNNWNLQKHIIGKPQEYSKLDLGFAAFFLNRTNRSGILKAGVIGGKEQAGKWKINARFNKSALISRISKIASYESRIVLTQLDAVDLIIDLTKNKKGEALFYLDPPYYKKGQGLYRNYYEHDDHVNILNVLKESNLKNWVVSYDYVPEITEIYKSYRSRIYSLQYSAQEKRKSDEVMFYSNDIIIPESDIFKI